MQAPARDSGRTANSGRTESYEPAPKQASNEVNWSVGTTSKRANNFNSYQRETIDAETLAQHFAPTGDFDLDPLIVMSREQCEALISAAGSRLRCDLSKPGINKRRNAIAKVESEKNMHNLAIAQLDRLLKKKEAEEKLFMWAESLRQLATK